MPPTLYDPLRAAAVCLAGELLAKAAEHMPAAPVIVNLPDGFYMVHIEIAPCPGSFASNEQPASNAPLAGEIPDLVRAVLRQTPKPVKLAKLARLTGKDPATSHFRRIVKRLVDAGEVRHLPGHFYWLAERPLPSEQGGAAGAG